MKNAPSSLPVMSPAQARGFISAVEEEIKSAPGSFGPDSVELPLKHQFADGLYIRQIKVKAGVLLTTKIHKKSHPFFVLKGSCSVLTDNGVQVMNAPFYGITPAGTKRMIYIRRDVLWVTVHATEETDLDLIEEELISPDFESLGLDVEKVKLLTGEKS